MTGSRIAPCLWFGGEAEAVARFYCAAVPGSRADAVHRSPVDRPAGKAADVLLVAFTLAGQRVQALNGGATYRFTPAISLSVACDGQAELDRTWDALLDGGGEPMACGWLTDRYGVSWQVAPREMGELLSGPGAGGMMAAMMGMVKLDVAALRRAAADAAA